MVEVGSSNLPSPTKLQKAHLFIGGPFLIGTYRTRTTDMVRAEPQSGETAPERRDGDPKGESASSNNPLVLTRLCYVLYMLGDDINLTNSSPIGVVLFANIPLPDIVEPRLSVLNRPLRYNSFHTRVYKAC